MKNRKKRYILIFMLIIITFCILVTPVFALILNDLDDVNVYVPKECNFLHYNGTMWTNYDLWNQSVTWYKPHDFIDNITAINITAINYFGDGGNLTGIGSFALPSYLNAIGHPHNQDLNASSYVNFTRVTSTFSGDGGNITNITMTLPSYLNAIGHPHNQDLNTTSNTVFNNITADKGNISATYNISVKGLMPNSKFIIGNISTGRYGVLGLISSTTMRLAGLGSITNLQLFGGGDETGVTIPDVLIDDIGAITLAYQPSTRVRLLNNQIVGYNVWNKMNFTVNDYDLNNDWLDANYSFKVPVAGLYSISYSLMCVAMPDRTCLAGRIYKNDAPAGGYVISYVSSAIAVNDVSISGSDILHCTVNDYISLWTLNTRGSGLTAGYTALTYTNYLSICKIA
jgi:hypothetical protein